MAKLGVSAIRINCQDFRPEVYGVEKMEIVTDYSEVVIEASNLIMKKAVFGDWGAAVPKYNKPTGVCQIYAMD